MRIDFSKFADKAPQYDLQALLEAGCHFGHQKRKWHPKMSKFIYMEKDGIHIFDLAKTAEQLRLAYNFAYDLGKNGKTVVMIGTKRQAREIIKAAAMDSGAMHITSRWLGGLMTNFDQINQSLKRMLKIESGLKDDTFKGYTKFEKLKLEKEQGRLERFFDGIRTMKSKPDCLFVVDPVREKLALVEAEKVGVPVIALADSNANPDDVALAIPANDDALSSIKFIVEEFARGYKEGKSAK